jgi:hypothetical protein
MSIYLCPASRNTLLTVYCYSYMLHREEKKHHQQMDHIRQSKAPLRTGLSLGLVWSIVVATLLYGPLRDVCLAEVGKSH